MLTADQSPPNADFEASVIPLADDIDAQIERDLEADRAKDLLRFSTAGSVDDGKSTLIGRLLYDSRNVYDDHIRSVTHNAAIDFAQLTDGLRAEREQGITIDVAYRYFSTPKRKFIIADTPGHEQYTRNMATGASTADVAIVLVDARKGILDQTRRHTCIAALLGIPIVIAAVNKMDLVDFSQEVFDNHRRGLEALAERLQIPELIAVPVSALEGDNVVHRSTRIPWYTGPSLLELLETVPLAIELSLPDPARASSPPGFSRLRRPDRGRHSASRRRNSGAAFRPSYARTVHQYMGGRSRPGPRAAVSRSHARRRSRSKPWRNDRCCGCAPAQDHALQRDHRVDAE